MKKKILMVCLGNICRSPLAEGIMSSIAPEDFIIDSAGTSDYHIGESPDKRSVETARKYGIDITSQRGRQFKTSDFDEFDHILVMDQSNFNDVIAKARDEEDRKKVRMILEYAPDTSTREVPDPYYGGKDGFEKVYDLLTRACDGFLRNHYPEAGRQS
ncbi:low molecular weight protein-tyrosine-phosphatase [Robertkochia aurantiaca]|uniref:low molecular weight protein-tyrosine-phosphatase n=1 Tax=Robertkochia aurantiaca TaxID=2873700 RepID=UPI001CCD5345|nr:low molecular weight protein-tyrosine-phosphatase [Robertkochia sp. 3YJGBD-33]